jgi:RNA polymerase sigma-70 factor (ECF subfamily)
MDVPSELEAPAATEQGEDSVRFESFFRANYGRLTHLLYRVVGDIHSAEELASEAFWRLHVNPPASDDNLEGWLHRTGLRLALDSLRKRKRRDRYEALAGLPEATPDPLETLERIEQRDRVRKALAALKAEQISLLVLRSEGYSLGEIASLLGLNPGSVGTMLARADTALRKEYVKRYGEQ